MIAENHAVEFLRIAYPLPRVGFGIHAEQTLFIVNQTPIGKPPESNFFGKIQRENTNGTSGFCLMSPITKYDVTVSISAS